MSIENTRKKNEELYVNEDEEHFLHCQKKLLRKILLTQIENLYTKLMGNNHNQNLEENLSSCHMQLAAPFNSRVISIEESGLNIAA